MAQLPSVRKRRDYADIGADDLVMALFHDRIAASQDPDAAPPEPELKYSRRHSGADLSALKACRTHLRGAMKALADAGVPDEDGDGVPDAMEAKAVPQIDPGAHAGAMVCLCLPPETQDLLRGLLPAELRAESAPDHVTICYLGGEAEAVAGRKTELLQQLTYVAESGGPVYGQLGGVARFNASAGSDDRDVLVALYDSPALPELYAAVCEACEAAGVELPGEHGFIPHITLAYLDPSAPTPQIAVPRAPLDVDMLTLVWAGERIDIPMTGEGADWEAEEPDEEDEGGEAEGGMGRAEAVLRQALALAPAAAEIKMLADGRMLIPGVRYGAVDLVGDRFTKSTDLGAARSFVGMPVYYDHAQRGIKSQIGSVVAYQATDEGIDFLVELDRHHRYKAVVERLYAARALGGSTGAASHLVVREGGELKRWIVAELSVTPTPAEPENLIPSTKAQPEAPTGEAARLLAGTHTRVLAYRLRGRYAK